MKQMRLILMASILTGFLMAGQTTFAVDKVERKAGSAQTTKRSAPKPTVPAPKKIAPPLRPASPKKPDPSKKKYDDFIDKNKNGIDDRREKPGT